MDDKNSFYVTTPIYYVTAKPHLGHLYSTVLADVAARWNKILGKQTFFLTGTDEHGQKIAQAAQKAGKEPQVFVDSFIDAYKSVWSMYEIEYDHFIRTTDEHHVKAVQHWIELLEKNGDIYKGHYQGWYCVSDEAFVAEASDAVTQPPVCPTCGRTTTLVSEESYFFKLSKYQDKLLALYDTHPEFIIPHERAHEVINFVKGGLKDLSISRTTISWGIPFPHDPKHVTYVWADALNNYITGIGWPDNMKEFNKWWPANLQIMGKDIIRFHAVYWPAFLMATGLELPEHLLVHGWFKVNAQKMSKSFGNVVDPVDLHKAYGAEPVRYYLTRYMAITHDSEFSTQDLEQKISSDLANDLGNLLNRMLLLAQKNNVHEVKPAYTESPSGEALWHDKTEELFTLCWNMIEEYDVAMSEYKFHIAQAALWKFVASVNAYFHALEPWRLAKSNPTYFNEVLSATCHSLRVIGILLWPILPKKMEALLAALGERLELNGDLVEQMRTEKWVRTFKLNATEPLFHKYESVSAEQKVEQNMSYITIDDFTKVELIVGTITSCQEVPKSDKLYQLTVDFGDKGVRQILSGVRKHFTQADLLGKQGVFVFNLQPRQMLGLESQGMMLFAENANGKNELVSPVHTVPNGTRLK